jgi:para-nitrobenzyl esterase
MMPALTPLLGMLLALGEAGPPSAPARAMAPERRLDSGTVRGLVVGARNDVHVYKGIPFAAPPVGELRWKPPAPVRPWSGVRDCFEFGAACPQRTPALLAAVPEMALRVPTSEDCLYLNVWTPAERKSDKLPVLYWIHGGGFIMGAASQPLYDGEELARLGCVVVSVNYRLGLFGFLAHPALDKETDAGVSGNYGLLDQVEGLRWVRRNIAAFGGDPERVTIFGESAGGISVLCLLASSETRGLFQRAIAQSAAAMTLPQLRDAPAGQESAEQLGLRWIKACGLDATADARQLRKLTASALVKAAPFEDGVGAPLQLKPLSVKIGPAVDGRVLPDQPRQYFAAGRQQPVPLIIGNTRDEMSLFLMTTRMPADAAAYKKALRDTFGDLADPVAKAYPGRDAAQIRSAIVQLTSDLSFVRETRSFARSHAAAKHPTYRYQFSRGTRASLFQSLGAHHGAELPYVFQWPALRDDSEKRTSRILGRYWLNFAATGDPNGGELPPWPAYRAEGEEMIDVGDNVTVRKGYRNEQLDLADRVVRSLVR